MRKANKTIGLIAIIAAMISAPLLAPTKTYADLGAPYTYSYDVVVTNPNGAKTESCDTNATIPAGTRLTIFYDYKNQNEKFLVIKDEDYKSCSIRASDADYAEKTFDLSSVPKETPISKYTLNEESYLYKGPNERYGKNDDNYHLPAGVIVTSAYHDGVWMYVEYEGHTGWIYHYNTFQSNPKVANVATGEYFITTRNKIELKDTPSEDGKVVDSMSVEPFTSIPITYFFSISKVASWVYINNYNQHSGWYYRDFLSQNAAAATSEYNKWGVTIRDAKLAETVDQAEGPHTIPANTEINALYYVLGNSGYFTEERYYVKATIGSSLVEGWIDSKNLAFSSSFESEKEKTYEYEQQLYDVVDGKPIGTIEAGTYYVAYHYIIRGRENEDNVCWYYINKKNADGIYEKLGWIKDLTDEEIEEIEKKKEKEIEEATTDEDPDMYVYSIDDEEDLGTNEQAEEALLWLIIGAGLVAVVIVVSLVIAEKHMGSKGAQDDDGPKDDEPTESEGEQKEKVETGNLEPKDGAKESAKVEATKAEENKDIEEEPKAEEADIRPEGDKAEENGTEENTRVDGDDND